MGPIDKELLGKEAAIDKLERATFEQARMVKEQEAELEVLQREAEEEEQTGIFDVRTERVETKSNEARAMEFEAQMFKAERARAGGRMRSRPSSLNRRRGSVGLRSRGERTCGYWRRSGGTSPPWSTQWIGWRSRK